jgi:hypothetical protein
MLNILVGILTIGVGFLVFYGLGKLFGRLFLGGWNYFDESEDYDAPPPVILGLGISVFTVIFLSLLYFIGAAIMDGSEPKKDEVEKTTIVNSSDVTY